MNKNTSSQMPIEENVNIQNKNVKFFGSYDMEASQVVYNYYGYFGTLYLSDDMVALFDIDEQVYDSAFNTFTKDIVDAVNLSLDRLGYTGIKYDVSPYASSYDFLPVQEQYKDHVKDIDYKELTKLVISTLKSKYKNFEEIFYAYDNYLSNKNYTRHHADIVEDLRLFLRFDFISYIPSFKTTLDKKAFYDIFNDTDSETDKDLILGVFCDLYNETLESSVKLSRFTGKYSDFLEKIDSQNLSLAKQNRSPIFHLKKDEKGPYIGVQVCLTSDTSDLVEYDKSITRTHIKTLCNAFLRELTKN